MAGLWAASSAGRRARPPAVVSPLMLALTTRCGYRCAVEARRQQIDPARARRQAVGSGDRVADDEQNRRARIGARARRRDERERQGGEAAAELAAGRYRGREGHGAIDLRL